MPPLPPLPKSELEIARIVWEKREASVRDVVDALPPERDLDYWTVQTYLRRLAEKGYLKVRREGRANIYLPRVKPTRVVRQMVDDFLQQMFDGEAVPLFQHLIRERGLSEKEIGELQRTLDELKDERDQQ
jgi:BlaI family transcriptional regulator, penicillinase repressor